MEQAGVASGERDDGRERARLIEVGLTDGNTLTVSHSAGSSDLDRVQRQLSADTYVALGEDLVVRSADVRYVRLRDENDGSSGGLLDTIKDKIGGGSMTGYGQGSTYEEPTQPGGSRVVRGQQGGGQRGFMDDYIGYGRRPWSETKPFFLTSEFLVLVLAAIGVGIAMATSDLLDSHRGWTLMAAIAIGYMISRGLAKSGARDPNPERRYRD